MPEVHINANQLIQDYRTRLKQMELELLSEADPYEVECDYLVERAEGVGYALELLEDLFAEHLLAEGN